MESHRRKIGRGLCVGLLLIPMVGCLKSLPTLDEVTSMKFAAIEPVAATQLICFWQPQIQQLPDPTSDGQMTIGLPGQTFLIGPNGEHADVTGSLAVAVYDDTQRPPGVPSRPMEMWHFTKETLQQMTAKDTRFGRCYALFVPWPPEWTDVTHVRISARYDTPGKPTIYSPEIKMKIEFQATAASGDWNVLERTRDMRHLSGQMNGVPDPSQFVHQMAAGTTPGQQGLQPSALAASIPANPQPKHSGWDTSVQPLNVAQVETVAVTQPAAMPNDRLGTAAWVGPPPGAALAVPQATPAAPVAGGLQPIIINRRGR